MLFVIKCIVITHDTKTEQQSPDIKTRFHNVIHKLKQKDHRPSTHHFQIMKL